MNKKNRYEAIVAFAVALAFILPTSAVIANIGEPIENEIIVDTTMDDTFDDAGGQPPAPLVIDWWPTFRHDPQHTGYSTSTAPNKNHLLWEYTTGGMIRSSIAVVDDKVYVSSHDSDLYSLNTDGTFNWQYTTGGAIFSSPTVADGKVYFGSADGNLYCLNTDGTFNWQYTTGGPTLSSPTVADGKVFIGSNDDKLYCLNAADGVYLWNYTTGSDVRSTAAVVDGKVYFGSNDKDLYCLDTDGTFNWQYTTNDGVRLPPSVVDGKVYISASRYLYCLNTDGSFNWQYDAGDQVYTAPAVAGGKVYFGGNQNLYCLNTDGTFNWQYNIGTAESSPAVADGKVFVGTSDNGFYCLDASDGSFIWNYVTGSAVDSSPAVVDGRVYVGSNNGKVYCFEQKTEVSVQPASQDVETGETFDVYVYIEPAEPIASAAIDFIYFDETLLQVDAVTLEGFFDPNPTLGSAGTIDNVNGKITDIYEFTTDASTVTAANNFLKITFTADATNTGTSAIDLDGILITDPSANPVSIEVIDGEATVVIYYDLDISIIGNGATDPAPGTYSYLAGTVVPLLATPDLGWSFDSWTGDVANPALPSTTITMNDDEAVTATFTEDHYLLDITTVGNGHVDVVPDQAFYLYGETPELTAVADPGWTFKCWTGDLAIDLLAENFEGAFPPIGWSLDSPQGQDWKRNDQYGQPNLAGGDGFSACAHANGAWGYPYYMPKKMEAYLQSPAVDLSTAIGAKLSFTASFLVFPSGYDYAHVDVSTDGGGIWTNILAWTTDHDPAGPGEDVDIDLTPFAGNSNVIVRWVYNHQRGGYDPPDGHFQIDNVKLSRCNPLNPQTLFMDEDKAVTATFTEDQYTLDITIVGNGIVTKVPDQPTYTYGTIVELTATPDPGWSFDGWSGPDAGEIVGNEITMAKDMEVTATFKEEWLAEITIEGTLTPPLRAGIDMIDYVMFGEKATAWDGVDGHDLPYPGTPPAPYVAGWFMTDFDYPYDELERDIRHYPAVPPNGKIWDLWVETDTAGNGETALITMTWDNTILQGNEYDYVILRDYLSGDTLVDMRATGTFVFTADHGMGYHFEIVCGFNHCPVGVDDEYETNQNTPLIVPAPGVLDNDYDLDGDSISVRSGSLVYSGPGSVDLLTDGSFEYNPAAGWFGTDSFSYEVTDGVCFDEATVTITVLELKGIDVNVGWNLISMPAYEENFDKTNIIVEYAGDYYTWAEAIANGYILGFTYGWSAGAYSNYDYLMRGDGYWLWAYVDCTLSTPSNVEPENHITTFDEDEGWYLVGAPYTVDLAKWQVRIHHDGIYHTWSEAVADGHILAYLYDWDRAAQNYVLSENPDFFGSGRGYWMYVYDPCSLKKA